MFKLIGIAVVLGVLFIGYEALQKWYSGDATPQATVTEVRKKVGEKILGDEGEPSTRGASVPAQGPAQAPAPAKDTNRSLDTDEMLRKMMEKK